MSAVDREAVLGLFRREMRMLDIHEDYQEEFVRGLSALPAVEPDPVAAAERALVEAAKRVAFFMDDDARLDDLAVNCEGDWVGDEDERLTCRDVLIEGDDEECDFCVEADLIYAYRRAAAAVLRERKDAADAE